MYPAALDAIKPPIWPHVMTAIGSVLLFAALLSLMFLRRQLALSAIAVGRESRAASAGLFCRQAL